MQPVSSLTADLGTSYQPSSPTFGNNVAQPTARAAAGTPPAAAPKMLTNPCEPSVPGGHDNINDDLIVTVNDILENAPLNTR